MDFVVFGAGAVGGVIGARLRLAGVPTTLIARGDHLTAIRDRGLVLETAAGRQAVDVAVAAGAEEVAWTDDTVVLLAVKSQQTLAALEALVAGSTTSRPRPTSSSSGPATSWPALPCGPAASTPARCWPSSTPARND